MTTKDFWKLYNVIRLFTILMLLTTLGWGWYVIAAHRPSSAILVPMFLFTGSWMVQALLLQEIRLVRRWRKLIDKNFETFPRTQTEREMLKKGSWIYAPLRMRAKVMQTEIIARDKCRADFQNRTNEGVTLGDLVDRRGELRELEHGLKLAEKTVGKASKEYLAVWDLFKIMGMLPDDCKDPEEFRKKVTQDKPSALVAS